MPLFVAGSDLMRDGRARVSEAQMLSYPCTSMAGVIREYVEGQPWSVDEQQSVLTISYHSLLYRLRASDVEPRHHLQISLCTGNKDVPQRIAERGNFERPDSRWP
jgi:hypothetical protein